jgi:glycosyltransferase involved in cell wall biosynthesis
VVVNGIDATLCRDIAASQPAPPRQGLLCVGHFDPRKNQLALIQALRDTDMPIKFVGQLRRMHRRYFLKCLDAAGPGMEFLGNIPPADVLKLMLASQVHVCPSLFETPGLANIEAAAMGCKLALGDSKPVREYFKDEAIYFDPSDPGKIRSAVQAALGAPQPPLLAQRVMQEFTWDAAAISTLATYQEVCGND